MDDASLSARATEAERVFLEWLEARERGDATDTEQLLRLHPDLADALRERLQAIELVDAALDVPDEAVTRDAATGEVVDSWNADDAAPSRRSIGEFQIVREIGRGGMGIVYEAEQTSMRRRVALKVLFPAVTSSPKAALRFQREARAAGRLHHTNVVPVYGMGEDRGVWWYAMEHVHGRPLDAVIEDVRRLRGEQSVRRQGTTSSSAFGTASGTREHFERVAGAFAGVAEGLDVAHQAGIVHRDVKPSNLILDAEGRLMLTDFGLARVEDEGPAMTLSGEMVGTPAYMSPEQVRASPEGIDARTDVYSLGATLYEVLTLRAPFHGATPGELYSAIASKDPAPPRRIDARIPRDLATIVEKAMEKDRARRYATAGDMARDLRLYAEGAGIRAKRIGPLGRAWRTAKRHKATASLAAAVAVLALGGGVAAFRALRAEAAEVQFRYAALCVEAEAVGARGIETGRGSGISIAEEQAGRARRLLDRAIELDPDRPEAYFGRALAGGAAIEVRLDDLEKARARGLGETTYHLSRALLFRTTGRAQESGAEERTAAELREAETPEDMYFRGRLLMNRNRRRDAIEAFTAALRTAPAESFVRHMALFARALAQEAENELPGAIADYAALVEAGGAGAVVRVRLASLWRRIGQQEGAEHLFSETLEEARRDGSLAALQELSAACETCRETAWAERVSEATAQSYGDDCDVMIARSAALATVRQSAAGLVAAERAVFLEPGNARAHVEMGRRLLELVRSAEAVETFGRALAISPGMLDACRGRAEAYVRLRNPDEAVAAWRQAVDADPADPLVHEAYGAFLRDRLRDYDGAEVEFRKAIDLGPDEPWFRFGLAKSLAGRGERDKAAATCRELAGRLRDDIVRRPRPLTQFRLGLTFSLLHELDGDIANADAALTVFGRVIALIPRHRDARYETGMVLLRKGDLDGAAAVFNEVLRIDPGDAAAHFALGVVSERRDDLARAAVHYRDAARLEPTDAKTLNNLGRCLLLTEDLDGAEAVFQAALEIDPDAAAPTFNMGSVLFRKHQYLDAMPLFRKGAELAAKQLIRLDLGDMTECERLVAK